MKRAIAIVRTLTIIGIFPGLFVGAIWLVNGLIAVMGVEPHGGVYFLFFLIPMTAALAILVGMPSAAVWLALWLLARHRNSN